MENVWLQQELPRSVGFFIYIYICEFTGGYFWLQTWWTRIPAGMVSPTSRTLSACCLASVFYWYVLPFHSNLGWLGPQLIGEFLSSRVSLCCGMGCSCSAEHPKYQESQQKYRWLCFTRVAKVVAYHALTRLLVYFCLILLKYNHMIYPLVN